MARQVIRQLQLRSPAFSPGERIPRRHARSPEGLDISPALTWSPLPANARELVIICDDPDAPQKEPWVHWVAYGIPASARGLPEGIEKVERPGNLQGMVQGKNSWDAIGYGGPLPPIGHGTHEYHLRLWAVDAPLQLGPGATKDEVLKMLEELEGHIVAEGELVGTYERLAGRGTSEGVEDEPDTPAL